MSREVKCDIFGRPTTLNMACRINMGSKPNVSLQWFYADSIDKAGRNGIALEDGSNVDFNYSVTVHVVTTELEASNSLVAMLELGEDFALGYYWCKVTGAMDSQHQNPSQVMRISTTCHPGVPCNADVLSTGQRDLGRCANGNFPENITIVDVQDTAACTVFPTDEIVDPTENVAITESDGKTDSQGGES